MPDFKPARVLDFGSGIGSAFWAMEQVWPRVVREAVVVEASRSMQELAAAVRDEVRHPAHAARRTVAPPACARAP